MTRVGDGSYRLVGCVTGQSEWEQHRLNLETWFRGIALMLVVAALVFHPIYALIFKIPGTSLADVIAPVTGIAGAVVGYWFGQASRRIPTNPPSSGCISGGGSGGGSPREQNSENSKL